MINNNTNNPTCQQYKISNPKALRSILEQPENYFERCTHSELSILNQILSLSNNTRYMMPSAVYIYSKVGVSESTYFRAIKKFEQDGILTRYRRSFMTNLYRLNELFLNIDIRKSLVRLLPACKWIPICLLTVFTGLFGNYGNFPSENDRRILKSLSSSSLREYIYLNVRNVKIRRLDFEERHEARFIKKEKVMKQFKQTAQPEWLESVSNAEKRLRLTNVGMKELRIFPPEAINDSLKQIEITGLRNIRDHFKFFFSLCKKYCEQNEIRPDYDFGKQFNTDKDAPRYEHVEEKSPYKWKTGYQSNEKQPETSVEKKKRINQESKGIVKKGLVDIEKEKAGLVDIADQSNEFVKMLLNSVEK